MLKVKTNKPDDEKPKDKAPKAESKSNPVAQKAAAPKKPAQAPPDDLGGEDPAMMEQLAAASDPAMMGGQDPNMVDPSMGGGGQVDPMTAVYRSPDQGPFACGNCVFFQQPNACSLVMGEIYPDGVCNLFTSAAQPQEGLEPEGGPEGMPPMGGPPVGGPPQLG